MSIIDTACQRIRSFGLRDKTAHSILNCVTRWLEGSGPEWTVLRLKEYKNGLQRLLAEERWDHPWITVCKDGCPSDPIGRLMAQAIQHKNKRTIAKALAVTSLSSIFINHGPATEKQRSKFFQSMLLPASTVVDEGFMTHIHMWAHECSGPSSKVRHATGFGLTRYLASASPNKRVPLTSGLRKETGCKESAPGVWYEDHALEVLHAGLYKPSLLPPESSVGLKSPSPFDEQALYLNSIASKNYKLLQSMYEMSREPIMGSISGIQEPGFKLRAVANPNRVVQIALLPLQEAIWTTLKGLPMDCTFDQDEGVRWAQLKLCQQHEMWSIDLSDATNRFPLDIQVCVLRAIYPNASEYIDLFKSVSSLSWQDRISETKRNVKFSVGQPLGLAPSFGSFALAHHVIMWVAEYRDSVPSKSYYGECAFSASLSKKYQDHIVEGKPLDQISDKYRILGDDVIIKDPKLAKSYMEILGIIGVDVSPHKTLRSKTLCQFAGKEITHNAVYPSYKVKSVSDNSFLEIVKTLGPPSISLLKERQRKVVSMLSEIPKEFGGLGWNPKGLPYMDRVDKHMQNILALMSDGDDEIIMEDTATVDIKHGRAIGLDPRKWLELMRSKSTRLGSEVIDPNTLFRVAGAVGIHNMKVSADTIPFSKGWVPSIREGGDPRGNLLESFEKKLAQAGIGTKKAVKTANVEPKPDPIVDKTLGEMDRSIQDIEESLERDQ